MGGRGKTATNARKIKIINKTLLTNRGSRKKNKFMTTNETVTSKIGTGYSRILKKYDVS